MINDPTVLVLGAGASMPFEFPSGEKLHEKICDNLRGSSFPKFEDLVKCGFSANDVLKFRDALFHSGTYSVDAFLEHRPEFVDIGKTAIAQILMPYEITENLFKHDQQNWYKHLWNVVYASWDQFNNNAVSILTFNYDRSIEHFLFTALLNRSGKSENECAKLLKAIPIIHLHGKLGLMPWEDHNNGIPYNPQQRIENIAKASQQIKIIFENVSNDSEFQLAHEALDKAHNIYFLGFGYNETNLERLQIKSRASNKNIWGTSLGLTSRQRSLAQTYSINLDANQDIYNFMRTHF